jgi:hypothetical protein
MATGTKFQKTVENLGDGVYKFKATGDTLKVYLSNTTPDVAAHSVKADLAEITNEHGYTAPIDTQNDASRTGGTLSVTGVDIVITASGGTVGAFRYVVLYDDTPTSPADPLIQYWDYGTPITLQDAETFTIDFGSSMATLA